MSLIYAEHVPKLFSFYAYNILPDKNKTGTKCVPIFEGILNKLAKLKSVCISITANMRPLWNAI